MRGFNFYIIRQKINKDWRNHAILNWGLRHCQLAYSLILNILAMRLCSPLLIGCQSVRLGNSRQQNFRLLRSRQGLFGQGGCCERACNAVSRSKWIVAMFHDWTCQLDTAISSTLRRSQMRTRFFGWKKWTARPQLKYVGICLHDSTAQISMPRTRLPTECCLIVLFRHYCFQRKRSPIVIRSSQN